MQRYSKKREAIIELFRSTEAHPSAEWVYAQLKPDFPDLSLATVYRNIAALLDSGELISVGVVDSKERYDYKTRSHPHFICTRCGGVIDVDIPSVFELEKDAEEATGAKVSRHDLTFRGVCRNCLNTVSIQE